MKTIVITAAILLMSIISFAQENLKHGWRHGYIITDDGKQEGIIIPSGSDDMSPWALHEDVRFIYQEVYNTGKVKNKDKLYLKPKDIRGYGFEDKKFETITYVNPARIGNKSEKVFMEIVENGRINLYKFLIRPDDVLKYVYAKEHNLDPELRTEYVLVKGDGLGETYYSADIISYIDDCEKVKSKYLNGGYGFMPNTNKSKNNLVNKIKTEMAKDDLYDAIKIIVNDYNVECND